MVSTNIFQSLPPAAGRHVKTSRTPIAQRQSPIVFNPLDEAKKQAEAMVAEAKAEAEAAAAAAARTRGGGGEGLKPPPVVNESGGEKVVAVAVDSWDLK
jgi:hypothetical protein